MTQTSQAIPMVEWIAESIRSTNFPTPGADFDPRQWWQSLMGSEPDSRVIQPKAGEWTEEGEHAGGNLKLSINAAGIIEWRLSPFPLKHVPAEFPMVGRFVDACEALCPIVRRWLELAPSLDRLAFGAVVLFPVANRRDGYEFLSRYLPAVTIDVENARDLLFQINRRRHSRTGIEGLEINRLSKWSVAELRIVAQPANQPSAQRSLPPLHACRVELDVNTLAEYRGGFTSSTATATFDELIMLAREILEFGDRP